MSNFYNYSDWYALFARLIKASLGLTMIEINGNGKEPPKPFVAFDVVSPYIPVNYPESTAFEAVVSFTVFADTKLKSLEVASQLRYLLNSTAAAVELHNHNLVASYLEPTQIRSTQGTNDFYYMTGFDVHLSVEDTTYEDDSKGEITTFDVNANPNEEERY